MGQYRVEKVCPMCGTKCTMLLEGSDVENYLRYSRGEGYIMNMFPHFNPMEREFIMTGYCPDCQKIIFGTNIDSEKIEKTGGF